MPAVDEQVAKAEKAVAGKIAVKRNRFVASPAAPSTWTVSRSPRPVAGRGRKGYTSNLVDPDPGFVTGAYHQLWRIAKSFRMSKQDLARAPVYHYRCESIDAQLTIEFAALAVTRCVEAATARSASHQQRRQ